MGRLSMGRWGQRCYHLYTTKQTKLLAMRLDGHESLYVRVDKRNLDVRSRKDCQVNIVRSIPSSCWLIRLCTYYVYMRLCHNLSLHKDMSFFLSRTELPAFVIILVKQEYVSSTATVKSVWVITKKCVSGFNRMTNMRAPMQ